MSATAACVGEARRAPGTGAIAGMGRNPGEGISVVIATCGSPHAARADQPLLASLARRGCAAAAKRWDDPLLDWSGFSACVVRSTWDWHLAPDRFVAWIHRVSRSTCLCNDAATLLWGLDKRYLLALEAAGVPVIPTVVVDAPERSPIAAVAAERGWDPFVVKPTLGASSYRTLVVHPGRDDPRAWASAYEGFRGPVLVQPFIHSVLTEGEVSVIAIDGCPTHAVHKTPAPGDFRVQLEHGGREEPAPLGLEHRRVAERCLAAIPGDPVYARIDMISVPGDGPRVIECEVVEPELYLDLCPAAAEALAAAVVRRAGE